MKPPAEWNLIPVGSVITQYVFRKASRQFRFNLILGIMLAQAKEPENVYIVRYADAALTADLGPRG